MSGLTVRELSIPGVLCVSPQKFGDSRGYFMETFHGQQFAAIGIDARFVQDNQSLSALAGTVRGLHFQCPPGAQAKLVRVLRGTIFDAVVDIRRASPTYGKWCGATLTATGGEQLFVPRGFAHAFCTLEPDTEVSYKVDSYYAPELDAGLFWNDPAIGIEWPVAPDAANLSAKDRGLPLWRDFDSPFSS